MYNNHDHGLLSASQDGIPALLSFNVYHLKYPTGGLKAEERVQLNQLLREARALAAPSSQAIEFGLPAVMDRNAWRELVGKHCHHWRLQHASGIRMERAPESEGLQKYTRYLRGLKKSFPDQISQVEKMMSEADAPPPDLLMELNKTENFEGLFPDQTWRSPSEVLLGFGGFVLFCVDDRQRFEQQIRNLMRRGGSTASPPKVPLFTIGAFEQASAAVLNSWFSLFNLYAIEYGYHGGLVLASRTDLGRLVKAFQSALD